MGWRAPIGHPRYSATLWDKSRKRGSRNLYSRAKIWFAPSKFKRLIWPAARHNLSLRIEMHSVFAQGMQVAEK